MNEIKNFLKKYIVEAISTFILGIYFLIYYIFLVNGSIPDFYAEFRPEILSIYITVIVFDRIIRYREGQLLLEESFESDVHNYSKFFDRLTTKVKILYSLYTEKNIQMADFVRTDILSTLIDEPLRMSFSNQLILKDKKERIDDTCEFAGDVINRLSLYLNSSSNDLQTLNKIQGELYIAYLSILQLRTSNKRISELGETILERHKRLINLNGSE